MATPQLFQSLMTPAPAVGKGVVAVGSAQNSHYPAVYGFKDSRGRSMKYGGGPWPVNAPATGLVVYDLRKIAASTSAPNELGCDLETWDAAAKLVQDKSNSIIAVPYGGICSWGWKITIAQVSGFRYSLVYSLQDGDVFDQEYNSLDPLPPYYGITINAVDGRALTGGLPNSKEGEYKLFFTSKEFESHPQFAPGARSNFSSWGPTSDTLDIKPQISAPGGSILSTWPLSGTGYAILSSTSIAAPYASGAFALLKSQFPTATVQQLQEKLQSTAKNILYAYDKDLRPSIAQQAGGLINVRFDELPPSASGKRTVSPSEINLGDLDALKPQEITIKNNSNRSKTYVISMNQRERLTSSRIPSSFRKFQELLPCVDWKFVATFQPPHDIADVHLPVYPGFIRVTNNHEVYGIAYLGQLYSRFNAKYLSTSNQFGEELPVIFYLENEETEKVVNSIQSFDFGENSAIGFPWINFANLQSTQIWRADIVPYNTTFVPDVYGFTFNVSNSHGVPDSALPLVYPKLDFLPVEAGIWLWWINGQVLDAEGFSNGEVPAGDYRALLRVLKWGGDPEKKEHYESWLSPILRIVRP
ncbi:hypothetical protein BKA61DRAFT_684829 [Leptodontidium sp. MPI-SDFR-AT-0119]|nr:hypothetical protein BKA61DRAFT_684829 [Leptodontidium sp. MPI-SDFR-AT-0119]